MPLSFSKEASDSKNHTVEQLAAKWLPIAKALFALMAARVGNDPLEVLSDAGRVGALAEEIAAMAFASKLAEQPETKSFIEILA
ncbi:MAG: hypothetical protein ABS93_00025 [Thiobacillus sp. SCN 62-729]|nr:MAG: hypothetical protein ABS93_00025 [Thiobacillus sp. SCN 62-729]